MASNSEFFAKYSDPRWQRKRLEIMHRDGFKCKCCNSETETLNVHHAYYERDTDPWDYPSYTLVTLCKPCHDEKHALKQSLLVLLAYFDRRDLPRLLGYGCAIASSNYNMAFTLAPNGIENGIIDHFGGPQINDRWYEALYELRGKLITPADLSKAEAYALRYEEELQQFNYDRQSYAAFAFNC